MIINLHNGKTLKVSEKKFQEYSKHEDNREDWLQFRINIFSHYGFSREELIMNPRPNIWFDRNRAGKLKEIYFINGKFHAGFYCEGRLDENLFDTPEQAYEYLQTL